MEISFFPYKGTVVIVPLQHKEILAGSALLSGGSQEVGTSRCFWIGLWTHPAHATSES